MAKNEIAIRDQGSAERSSARQAPGVGAYVRPWVITGAMVPAGWAAHLMWGDAGLATGLATAAVAATGGTLTMYAHWLTRARTWYAHTIATASVATTTAWLAAATVAGTGRPLLDIGLWVGGGLAVFSNLHTWGATQGSAEAEAAPAVALPSWETITARIGGPLKETRMEVTEASDTRTSGVVQLPPGRQKFSDLASKTEDLASAYRLPPGAVRVARDPEDSSQARITVVTQDMLKTPIPWPGLRHEGASIAEAPVPIGLYEDAHELSVDPRNQHTLTVGMSGAGKSRYAKVKLLDIASRRDTYVVAIDTEKGRQTLGSVLPAVDLAVFDKKRAKKLIQALHKAVYARADHLADQGLENWEPGCGLVWVYLLLEEASSVISDMEAFTDLMKVARSAGIHIEASLQRATWSNIDTDARANFGSSMCFGVRDDDDATFALPEHIIEGGAAPQVWGKRKPGYVYAAIDGIDEDRQAIPGRAYDLDTDTAAQVAARLPRTELDPVTAAALGPVLDDQEPTTAPTPRTTTATVGATAPEHDEDDMDEDEEAITFDTPDPNPDLQATIDAPIEAPEDGGFVLPPKKRSQESAAEARAALDALLADWSAHGQTAFRAPDVGRALRETGVDRSRSWVIGELNRLEDEERVTHEDDGTWTIAAGELALA